jgi:ribonuclease E
MVERPIDEEPPIAEVEAPAEPQPKKRRSRAKSKSDDSVETAVEPSPIETPSSEVPEETKPAKPVRKSRAKKAKGEASAPESEQAVPTADNDEADDGSGDGPRRGWWQRTFG